MTKPGRLLEVIVAQLEAMVASSGLVVTSPAFLPGHMSGTRREVDVAITSDVGSSEALAIAEVRDRRRRQGVDWIEQVISKRRDIGADVALAVSSSGFTASAIRVGAEAGVRMWTLCERDPTEILSQVTKDNHHTGMGYVDRVVFRPIVDRAAWEAAVAAAGNEWVLRRVDTDSLLALRDLIVRIPDHIWAQATLSGGDRETIQCILQLPRSDGFDIEIRSGSVAVGLEGAYIEVETVIDRSFSYGPAYEYMRSDGLSFAYIMRHHPVFGDSPLIAQTGGETRWDEWTWVLSAGPLLVDVVSTQNSAIAATVRHYQGGLLLRRDGPPLTRIETTAVRRPGTTVRHEDWLSNDFVVLDDFARDPTSSHNVLDDN
jgi:hypothetical protein